MDDKLVAGQYTDRQVMEIVAFRAWEGLDLADRAGPDAGYIAMRSALLDVLTVLRETRGVHPL
jgi:hypothetical protein